MFCDLTGGARADHSCDSGDRTPQLATVLVVVDYFEHLLTDVEEAVREVPRGVVQHRLQLRLGLARRCCVSRLRNDHVLSDAKLQAVSPRL